MSKFDKLKKGDCVKVIAETCGHEFEIGEYVIFDNYYADRVHANFHNSDKSESWVMQEEEFELVEKQLLCNTYKKSFTTCTNVPSVTPDPSNPNHYKKGKIECWDAIESAVVGKSGIEAYYVGNIIKYLWRYEDKNGAVDVQKARVYIDKLLKELS